MKNRSTDDRLPAPVAALAALAVLAPAMGGSSQLWAQAVLVLGLAAVFVISPARRSPGLWWLALLIVIFALSLTGFLPAHWFGLPGWRETLIKDYSVELPATSSPQPWLTAEATGVLFAGLTFTACLLAHPVSSSGARRRALTFYALGIVLLALVALGAHVIHHKPPFWPQALNSSIDFGFFPNRNQTANVLALAGIITTALAADCLAQSKRMGWLWVGATLVIGVALVINYSRAGIALFIGGIAAWMLVSFALSTSRKWMALGLAGLALLLTLFFLFGGETLQRFRTRNPDSLADYRVAVQTDAWRLANFDPWTGQGLGNFEPIFAMARDASAGQNRALHPESDWLWAAVEMGWPAIVLVAVAFLLWLRQCFPFSPGTDPQLRAAAAVCGVAFAVHGLVDVSGHRLGTVWPAIFLATMALHPGREVPSRSWVAPAFRLCGLVLAALGLWWLGSVRGIWSKSAPTSHTLAQLTRRLDREVAEGAFAEAVSTAHEALRIGPLDWHTYYQRGVAEAATSPLVWVAARDFRTARYLEPGWADSCYAEGKLWLALDQPNLTLEAWIEALNRAGKAGPALFARMLDVTGSRFAIRSALQNLARPNPDYLLVFLQYADRLEFDLEIGRLLDADPTLKTFSPAQRKTLFGAWFDRGDRSLLASHLRTQPAALEEGWPALAQCYAEDHDYQRAYGLVRRFEAAPTLPSISTSKPLATLENQFRFHPDNFQEGIELYSAQHAAGNLPDAISTLTALQAIPTHPTYVAFLEAELRADQGQWEKAWQSYRRFREQTPR